MPTMVTPLSGWAGASSVRLRFVGLGADGDLPFFLIAMEAAYFLLFVAFTKHKVNSRNDILDIIPRYTHGMQIGGPS